MRRSPKEKVTILYIYSVVTINRDGHIVNHHRKLMPTYTEKLVHGLGDGAGLNAVQTDFGNLGALICWEHWMPMTRQAMHDENEDLHIALWPYVKEMHHIASRHYAIEGRCHVVSVGQMYPKTFLPEGLQLNELVKDEPFLMKGGSAIYDATGTPIMDPIYNQVNIFTRELDLSKDRAENMNLSVSGHYQRQDVFEYEINKKRIN